MQSQAQWLERQETVQQDGMKTGEAVLKKASEKLQAALKNKDFEEGPVAQSIIEAAHKNIASEDRVAVGKANVCVKTQTMHDIVSFLLYFRNSKTKKSCPLEKSIK